MSDDKTIVQFPRSSDLPECPVDVERRWTHCAHDAIRLVEHDRAVLCVKCGATLDPFAYLVSGAHAVRHAWSRHGEVVAKTRELQQRLEDLEKERRRLAQAVKRMKLKATGDVLNLRDKP